MGYKSWEGNTFTLLWVVMEMKQICMSLIRIHDLHKLGTTWNSDSRYIKTWPKTWLWHILNMLIVMHISLQKSYKQIVLLVRTHCQVYNPIFVVHYYHHIFWHLMHKLMNKGDFSFPIATYCPMLNYKLLEVYIIVYIVTCITPNTNKKYHWNYR